MKKSVLKMNIQKPHPIKQMWTSQIRLQRESHWKSKISPAWLQHPEPPRSRGDSQHSETTSVTMPEFLEISGKCIVSLQGPMARYSKGGSDEESECTNSPLPTVSEIEKLEDEGTNIVVAAWFHGEDGLEITRCSGDSNLFGLRVKIPPHPSETLKISSFIDTIDDESKKRKLFPLQTCAVHIKDLVLDKEHVELCNDQYNPSLQTKLVLKCHTPSIPLEGFVRSSLRDIQVYNEALKDMSISILETMNSCSVRPPKTAEGFAMGLTYAPFIGMPSSGVPSLSNHYALLGAHLHSLQRPLPIALPCYFLVNSLSQSPYTRAHMERFLRRGLDSPELLNFVADVITGFTKDATMVSYQRDATPTVGIECSFSGARETIAMTTTEDMNYLMDLPGMYVEAQLKPEDLPKVSIPASATLEDLKKIFKTKSYIEVSRCLGKDDCESSSFAACLLADCIKNSSWKDLKSQLAPFHVFSNLTPSCHQFIQNFFEFVQEKMKSGEIQVVPVVGLAGAASAEHADLSDHSSKDSKDKSADSLDSMEAGGHCYGVMRVFNRSSNIVFTRIIEGTNATDMKLPHEMFNIKAKVGASQPTSRGLKSLGDSEKELDICKFACLASKSLLEMTRICNSEVGESMDSECEGDVSQALFSRRKGWDSPHLNRCETRAQLSLQQFDPLFYQLCMYVNASLNVDSSSSQQKLEKDPQSKAPSSHVEYAYVPCSDLYFSDSLQCAGCLPKHLPLNSLQGFVIDSNMFPLDMKLLGDRIWAEVFRPIAPLQKFIDVMAHWEKVPTLASINEDLPPISVKQSLPKNKTKSVASPIPDQLTPEPGFKQKYVTINCMESPSSPVLVEPMYRGLKILEAEVNRLQQEDPQSDGAILKVHKTGTGVTRTLFIPIQEGLKITFFGNLIKAISNTGFYD